MERSTTSRAPLVSVAHAYTSPNLPIHLSHSRGARVAMIGPTAPGTALALEAAAGTSHLGRVPKEISVPSVWRP